MFLSLSSVGVFANAVDVAAIDTVVIIIPTADSTVAAAEELDPNVAVSCLRHSYS